MAIGKVRTRICSAVLLISVTTAIATAAPLPLQVTATAWQAAAGNSAYAFILVHREPRRDTENRCPESRCGPEESNRRPSTRRHKVAIPNDDCAGELPRAWCSTAAAADLFQSRGLPRSGNAGTAPPDANGPAISTRRSR